MTSLSLDDMPHETLTVINGTPTPKNLFLLQRELYANATSIYAPTGGEYGHLALLMSPAAFLTLAETVFVVPPIPPAVPAHAANATAAQITETNRQHRELQNQRATYRAVEAKLKKQVLTAVELIFVETLSHIEFGFARVTARELLEHLWATYGKINATDIEKNRESLSNPWNPDDPIELLWTRIAHVKQFATKAGEPLSEAAIIRLTLPVFFKTGLFSHALTTWNDKAETSWTLALFQTHFNKANEDRNNNTTTIQNAGFHGANAAVNTSSIPTTTNTAPTITISPDNIILYYCWSHGLSRTHGSNSCNHPKPGHQTDATFSNRMGGAPPFGKTRTTTPRNTNNTNNE